MKSEYYKQLEKLIKNKSARGQIAQELESHIDEKTEYFIEIGYSEKEAEEKAIESMGDVESYAVSLAHIHKTTNLIYFIDFLCMASVVFLSIFFIYLYLKLSSEYSVTYGLLYNFLSFGGLGAYIGILIYSYRYKRKAPVIFLGLHLVPRIMFTIFTILGYYISITEYPPSFNFVFKPFWYGIITICTNGLPEYIDKLFFSNPFYYDYYYHPDILPVLATLTYVVLISFAVLITVSIFRQEYMKNTRKLNKGLKILGKVFCTFFVCYFVLVSCSAFNVFLNIEEKYKSINADKHQLIDLVVNTDKNKNYDIKDKLMKEYSLKMIYDYSNDGDVDIKYAKDCNIVQFIGNEEEPYMLYQSTIFTKSVDDNSYFTWKNFTDFKRGTTLKDFMKTEISHQAHWVSKDETGYSFDYYIENIDDEYRGMEKLIDVHLEFDKNGVLIYNEVLAESMYYDFIK